MDTKLISILGELQEQITARIGALQTEVQTRLEAIERLRSMASVIDTLPLWEAPKDAAIAACVLVGDDEFDHLTAADAAAEVLRRCGRAMHAKDIWFAVMRGRQGNTCTYPALVTCLNRMKRRFRKVGKNVFELAPAAASSSCPSGAVAEFADAPA